MECKQLHWLRGCTVLRRGEPVPENHADAILGDDVTPESIQRRRLVTF